MSEPKARAKSIRRIVPGLYHWHLQDERIGARSDAYAVVDAGHVTLIDPLPLASSAESTLAKLIAAASSTSTILTGSCHQRAAWRYRGRFGAKVHAPAGAEGLEEPADAGYAGGDRLPGGLLAVHTPGPTEAHFSFLLERSGGVLFCADLLVRSAGEPLDFVPGEHQDDPARTRQSVRRLLEMSFRLLCPAHGAPLASEARASAREALRRDARRGGVR